MLRGNSGFCKCSRLCQLCICPITAQKLAYLLQGFGVAPRLQRISKTRTARGYRLQDFQAALQRFLNIEIVNNHAACNGVAPSGKEPPNGEIVRCSDHETGVDLAFASSQQLEAGSCSSDDPVTRCTDEPIARDVQALSRRSHLLSASNKLWTCRPG